jgi:hypothetical protein
MGVRKVTTVQRINQSGIRHEITSRDVDKTIREDAARRKARFAKNGFISKDRVNSELAQINRLLIFLKHQSRLFVGERKNRLESIVKNFELARERPDLQHCILTSELNNLLEIRILFLQKLPMEQFQVELAVGIGKIGTFERKKFEKNSMKEWKNISSRRGLLIAKLKSLEK